MSIRKYYSYTTEMLLLVKIVILNLAMSIMCVRY